MNFRRLVLVFQTGRNIRVGSHHAIDKIRPPLNHPLVYQLLERLRLTHHTEVIEEHVPETRINQMPRGMFRSSQIQIDIPPILISLLAHQGMIVMGVHIAQVIGGGARKSRHGIQLYRITFLGFPILCPSQWRLAALRRQVLVDFRQLQGQLRFIHHVRHPVLVIHGEGFAPIPLAAEDGIPQAVIDFALPDAPPFHFAGNKGNRLLDFHAVNQTAVYHFAFLRVV